MSSSTQSRSRPMAAGLSRRATGASSSGTRAPGPTPALCISQGGSSRSHASALRRISSPSSAMRPWRSGPFSRHERPRGARRISRRIAACGDSRRRGMDQRSAFLTMASNVYHDPTSRALPPGEITSLRAVHMPEIGLRMEAYQVNPTGLIVVAIAGTNIQSLPSLMSAATVLFKTVPAHQIEAAESFIREVTSSYMSGVTLVGHSSGGLVAQLIAAKQTIEPLEDQLDVDRAIGFNSPGAAPFLPALFGNAIPPTFDNIESVCDSRDLVCRLFDQRGSVMGNSHIGSVEYINPVHDSEPLTGWALPNPANWPQILHDFFSYHGINHLADLDQGNTSTIHAVSGTLGLLPIVGVGQTEESPIKTGAGEFETFQTSSPIALDLDGDGIETQGLLAGAFFDHGGDGFAELTGWIGADDALLARDRNGDGRVDRGSELFGNETILAGGVKATDGYQALAELDLNADGRIDASDPVWSQLLVWRDVDGNGQSEASELHPLEAMGVAAIGTSAAPSTTVDANGNEHRLVGSFTRANSSAGGTADVWFRVERWHAVPDEPVPVPAGVATLPNVQGFGTLPDLQ